MIWLWTWSGKCFGFRDGNNLWTYTGKHVGKFHDNEVYDKNGNYLGEIVNDDRLITNKSKKSWKTYGFTPYANRCPSSKYMDYVGYIMYSGYEDFPSPERF